MRNRHAGTCYRCGGHVPKGAGHFERIPGGWRIQHAACCLKARTDSQPGQPAQRSPREV